MAAAQLGEADSYKTLLAEIASWLRRYCATRLPPAVTEDAIQEFLLAVHEKRHTYDPQRPFGPWLEAIAQSRWVERLRSLETEAADFLDESVGVPDGGETAVAGPTSQRSLAELTLSQVESIRLLKLEGYDGDDASRAAGQSVVLIKANIRRGLKRLATLAKAGDHAD